MHRRRSFFETAEGAARLREAYEACASAFSKSRRPPLASRQALRGFLAVAQPPASCSRKTSLSHGTFWHYVVDRMTCHILPRWKQKDGFALTGVQRAY